jgi:hypothetical protein
MARAAAEQIVVNSFGSSGSGTDVINQFELYNNGLYWTEGYGDCSVEFHSNSKIGVDGVIGGTPHPLISDCAVNFPGITRNDSYAFYTFNGRLWRRAINSIPTDPYEEISAPPYTPLSGKYEMGAMTTYNGRVYWSDSDGNYFDIVSMKEDATDFRYELLGNGSKIRKLQVAYYWSGTGLFGSTTLAFFILNEGGELLRFDLDPKGTTVQKLASGVTDFAIRDESFNSLPFFSHSTAIYASTGLRFQIQPTTPAGTVLRINAASGAQKVIHTGEGQSQITSVTVDDGAIYIVEQPVVGCGGLFGCLLGGSNMKRQTNPASNGNSANPFDLIDTTDGGWFNLRSDGQWLYFIAGTQVRRIRTDSPALRIDAQADSLEVVQAVQNLLNQVPLVANKRTFARGYAHLTVNTTDRSPWFPGARLHGFLNGVEAPDSPIDPVGETGLTTANDMAVKRPKLDQSFLFELPLSWVQPGQLRLSMMIDESHTIPETEPNPYANNSVSTPNLTVIHKGSPCLVFVPLWNNTGEYNPMAANSGFQGIIERAKSLMPVGDFHIFLGPGRIQKPVVSVEFHPECLIPFTFCLPVQVKITSHPFSMPDDKNWALFWTAVYNALNQNPSGCNDTHWVGTLPRDGQGGFNGIGGASGVKVGDLVDLGILNGIPIPATPMDNTLVVRMDPGQGNSAVAWDIWNGGHTLAHELGHNYGRFHIDETLSSAGCGTQKPDSPWQLNPAYPYDACTIGPVSYADPASFFGFDPITRSVIPPDKAGDTMSYAGSHWTSDSFWDALIGKVTSAASLTELAVRQQAGSNDQYLLLGGQFNLSSNSVELLPAHVLPVNAFDANFLNASLASLKLLPTTFPYRVRLLDAGGQVIDDQPLRFLVGLDQTTESTPFMQIMTFNPQTARVQVWGAGQMLSEVVVSPNKPVISLQTPVYNADTHRVDLSWSASDADGDPLFFLVLYSEDNGNRWQVVDPAHVSESISIDGDLLPGGNQALLRVIATDGLNSTIGDSVPFTVPAHAPKVVISGLVQGQRVAYGEGISLFGMAYQPEYGTLDGSQLSWHLSGPQTLSGAVSGSTLALPDLVPGHYDVRLEATGADNRNGTNTLSFEVNPLVVPDGTAPQLDGMINDPGYESAVLAHFSTGDIGNVTVRLLHANGFLYLGVDNLPYAGRGKAHFAVRVDTAGDRAKQAASDDFGFLVDEDGITSEEVAQAGAMVVTLKPRVGYSAVVNRGLNAWSAELKIDEALIGGWNHIAGLMFEAAGPSIFHRWPSSSLVDSPLSWAPGAFGQIASPTNRAPVAVAGGPQQLNPVAPMQVTLDGSGSFDPDGDLLTYLWIQIQGPTVTLSNDRSEKASFTAGPVTNATTLGFRLVANDGVLASEPSDVEVKILPATLPSSASIAPKQQGTKPDGSFWGQMNAIATPGTRFQIQATSNFVQWVSIGTNSLNYFYQVPFIDAQSHLYPWRFYRAIELTRTSTLVYSNDFEGVVGKEWSLNPVDTTPSGNRKYLGQFGNGGPRLDLVSLPTHNRVRFEFDLYLIRSWDGNDPIYGPDQFRVSVVNGSTLLDTTFACSISAATQNYPYGQADPSPALTGAAERGTLGFMYGDYVNLDAVYHFSFNFNHEESGLSIDFVGAGLQELTDESWGLDNVKVTVEENP